MECGQLRFNAPYGLASDAAGNVYVADAGNHAIRRIARAGQVSTIAGTRGVGLRPVRGFAMV
jgi:DNA-binding beta-propeller fold protein YncE